ncbi:MAG TPA: TonB-dependent receptor [Ignavibacteriales bacterium]|nr:TonB-dependent receptor [Ignavibacteriales bacterium]
MKKIISLLILLSYIALAGVTGKISGRVIDAVTKQPVPGVVVIATLSLDQLSLEDLMNLPADFVSKNTYGTKTDAKGNYIILNLPPGLYDVKATLIGYTPVTYLGVKVSSDLTSKVDFEIQETSIQTQTVVITAQAPTVRKDLTSTMTNVDDKQIKALPVENIAQILTLQAGITQGAGGDLHIRGGRSNEISYNINGVSTVNPFDNSKAVEIATNAIQELTVVSGTFNAEYGNALSGIVNAVTKEGTSKYMGNISFYLSDKVSANDDIFYNISKINPANQYVGEFSFSGPVPFLENYLTFFSSLRYDNDRGWLYGKREHNPSDKFIKDPLDPKNITIEATGDNKIVAMNPSDYLSSTFKLTFKPTSTIKINYDVIYSNQKYKTFDHDFKYNPDALYNNYKWGIVNTIELRHALSDRTFYTVRGGYSLNDSKRYLYPLLDASGKEVDYYPTKNWTNLRPDPRYLTDAYSNAPANYTFLVGGTQNWHNYQRTATIRLKFDITSQIDNNNEVKFGVSYNDYKLDYDNFKVLRDDMNSNPYIPDLDSPFRNRYTRKPKEISAFIQDKMEYETIIINAGVRYDFFSPDGYYAVNDMYPSPNQPDLPANIDKSKLIAKAKDKSMISPRLGISFPITEKGVIHFSYGHFYQMPPFAYLYANPDFKYNFKLGDPTFGNANLNPEKTVSYEIGLKQELAPMFGVELTAYSKDVRDLLALQKISTSATNQYLKYVNQDYANIKGFVVSFNKRRTESDIFGFTLDYTYQVAEGNENDLNSFFIDKNSGRQTEKIPVFLDWDQTHVLNGTLVIGKVGDWNLTFVGGISTGLPYTPSVVDVKIPLKTNSDRKPTQYKLDFMADKTLKLFGYDVTFSLKVYNLLDIKNELYVYSTTGRATYDLNQLLVTAQATNELSRLVPYLHSADEYFQNPTYYSEPREVRLGMSINF